MMTTMTMVMEELAELAELLPSSFPSACVACLGLPVTSTLTWRLASTLMLDGIRR